MMKKRLSTIYLKDNTFIPDFVVIPRNTNISFINDDASLSSYSIQCRQLYRVPEFTVRRKESVSFPFPNTGRFEITCPTVAHMKCVVEVCEDDEACETFFVDKECKPISSSALKSQQKQELRECDAISLLNRNRSSWAATAAQNEENEEDMCTQRRRQKAKIQHLTSPRNSSSTFIPPTISTGACADTSTATATSLAAPSQLATIRPKKHREIILIRDYAFEKEVVCVTVGSPLEFRLHESVPGHVEHELYSTSSHASLVFESPVLQQPHMPVWQYIPRVCGEMDISCRIYGDDMHLKVIITDVPHTASPVTPSSAASTPSIIKRSNRWGCVVGTGEAFMSGSSDRDASESSFADSDDDDSFASSESIDNISSSHHDHILVIEDFFFRPTRLSIVAGDCVKIISNSISTMHKISCDSQFDSIALEKRNDTFVHCFEETGAYRICNDIFSFMVCDITVEEPVAPQQEYDSGAVAQDCYHDVVNENTYFGIEQNSEQSLFEYRMQKMQKMHLIGSFPASPVAEKHVEIPHDEKESHELVQENNVCDEKPNVSREEENSTLTAAQKRRERRKKKKQLASEKIAGSEVVTPIVEVPVDIEPPPYEVAVLSPSKPVIVSPLKDACEVSAHVDWGLACDSFSDSDEDAVPPPPYSEVIKEAIVDYSIDVAEDNHRNSQMNASKLSFPPLIAKYNSLLKGADWSVLLESDSDHERDTPALDRQAEQCSKENQINSQQNHEVVLGQNGPKTGRKNKHKSRKKKSNTPDDVVISTRSESAPGKESAIVSVEASVSDVRNSTNANDRHSEPTADMPTKAPKAKSVKSRAPATVAATSTITTTVMSTATTTVVTSMTASAASSKSSVSVASADVSNSVERRNCSVISSVHNVEEKVTKHTMLLPQTPSTSTGTSDSTNVPITRETPCTPEKAKHGFMAVLQTASAKKRSRAKETDDAQTSCPPDSQHVHNLAAIPLSQPDPMRIKKLKELEIDMENLFLSRSQELRSKVSKKEKDVLPRGFQASIVVLHK